MRRMGRFKQWLHSDRDGHSPRWEWVAVLGILFVAYALYTSTLTLQSMWIDEVMALYFTKGTFANTLRAIIDPSQNGPLFYLLLYGWRQLVGESDFALRYLSLMFAVVTLPLLFQYARKLLNCRTATMAVWLFAFSPFVLWFAQEAKMYALHMMVAVASSLTLLEAFRKGRWWRWVLYAALVSALLYSHFFGVFLVVAQAGMALLLGWGRWKRGLGYVAAMLSLALTHAPLLRFGLVVLRRYRPRDIWRGFVPLDRLVYDALGHYFYRLSAPDIPWSTFGLAAALIALGALFILWRRQREPVVLVLHAFAPVLLFYAVSKRIPVYGAKYLSAAVPALFVLAALGLASLARLWRATGLLILVLGMLMVGGVVRDLTDPAVQRSDWRFAADYVERHEGESDVVVISAEYARHGFKRYYDGKSRVVPFLDNPYDPWPFYERQAERYDHMWLVLHQADAMAPGNVLREVADGAFPLMTGQYPNAGQIVILGYQLRFTYPAPPGEAQPLDVCFQNGLCLVAYSIDARSLPATERLSHPPSNWIHTVLYWQRQGQVDALVVRPLVRIVDDASLVWGGNMDRRPDLFDRYPPSDWPLDQVVETHFDLNLNPVTPAGTYRLEVSLAVEGDENCRVAVVDPSPGQPVDRTLFERIEIRPR